MNVLNIARGKIAGNLLFMVMLQGVQLLMPLILMPFVINMFGIEKFGLLSFATATCMLINVICDYGFNLTATRSISVNINDPTKVNQIFNSVILAKALLLCSTFVIYIAIVFSIESLRDNWQIYVLTFGLVVGNALSPLWLYQGFQNFKFISSLNIVFKIIFTMLIFVTVNEKADFYIVPLCLSLGYVVPGLFALMHAIRKYQLSFLAPEPQQIKNNYVEGWHIFISRIAVYSYTSLNIIFLDIFTSNLIVGYYTVASRVISAVSSVVGMVNQTLFPHLSLVWKEQRKYYFQKLTSVAVMMVLVLLCASVCIVTLAPLIVNILTGEDAELSIDLMRILSFALICLPLGGLFTQSFVTQQHNSLVTNVTLKTTVVNFIMIFIFTPLFGAYGMAFAVCMVQLFQVVINLYYLSKLKEKQLCAA